MTMFCKVVGGEASEYTVTQLRDDNPTVSFPKNPSNAVMAEYDMYPVVEVPPSYDPDTEIIVGYTIEGAGTTWTQTWEIRSKTPAELAADEDAIRKASLSIEQTPEAMYQTLSVVVQTLLDADLLSPTDLTKVSKYYRDWATGTSYIVGDIANYAQGTYKCVQAHTSQPDWTPPQVPALWTAYIDPTGPPTAWVQPAGAHDAYSKNIRVTHNTFTWVSLIDANVWEPGVYGWAQE